MSELIERIKKRIEARKWKITDDAFIPEIIGMQYANKMNDWCLEIIDKELAKQTHEEPNIPLECVDGSCPMALSDEYAERGMDVVHNCEECPYQPKKESQEYKWKDLAEKGLLIELPCKVGDAVYAIVNKKIIEDVADRIEINHLCKKISTAKHSWLYNFDNVFLTKEEAEQALAERKKNEK